MHSLKYSLMNRFFYSLLIFVVVFTCPLYLLAQSRPGMPPPEGVVTGLVLDEVSKEPVEYANIVLFRVKDSSMVNGGITNEKGIFQLTKVPFGKFYAMITFLGYQTLKVPEIMVTPKDNHLDLGTLFLKYSSARLKEVTISGDRPTMEYSLDKKVVNVEKNLATMGGSAVDVLQNVPSVTVDESGAVSLRGDANVTLLIDGRPSGLTGTKLDQIPASSIETVEIITNPSAKYNPEGMSGIINIKLKKKRETGFNGLISLNAGTGEKYNGSINLNYQVGKFNFFGSVDARNDRRKGWGETFRTTTLSDTTTLLENTSDNWRKRDSRGFKLGFDYSINDKNSLLISWMNNQGPASGHEFSENHYFDPNHHLLEYYTNESWDDEDNNGYDYILNYRRTFDRKGQELTLDAVYNTDKEDEDETRDQVYGFGYPDTLAPDKLKTSDKTTRDNLNIQLNYVHPFNQKIKLEGGYQGIFRSTDGLYDYFNYQYPEGTWLQNDTTSNHFVYHEQINAIYAILGMVFEKYSLQAGLRAENAVTRSEQRTMNLNFDKDYTSYYPSVHATRKLPLDQEIQLSYSRRVNRPNMRSLNPFVDYSDYPAFIMYGNPNLNPEYTNNYELGYSKYFKKSTFNTSLFYRKIEDIIKRYVFVDSNGVMNHTSMNMTSGISYGVEMVLDHSIVRWWRINANFSYFKTRIEGSAGDNALTNENYSWTSRVNNTITLPKKLIIQLNAFYRGPMVNPQGTMKEIFGTDLAIRKDFWKERANISFRLSDLFNTMRFRMENSGENFSGRSEHKRESRVAYLGLTLKIGKAANKQKRTKKPEDNGRDNMDEMDF